MSLSPNKGYNLQATGSNAGTWGVQLNQNVFSIIDSNLGGQVSINCAGSSNVVQNSTQAQSLIQNLSGVLTGSIEYQLIQAGGFWIIANGTTGAFTVTVKTSAMGSTGVIVPQGTTAFVYSDGTDVDFGTSMFSQQNYGLDVGTAAALVVTTRGPLATMTTGTQVIVKASLITSRHIPYNVACILG